MKSKVLYNFIREAVVRVPDVKIHLSSKALFILRMEEIKAQPITRDQFERRLSRAVLVVERKYLQILEESNGVIPLDFWANYERDLREQINPILRAYVEQSFSNYSDYVAFIDGVGAVGDIDTAMTRALDKIISDIANNSRLRYEALVKQGVTFDEIIERLAFQFGSGHAEQIAITELTRAEAYFSDALASRLGEQGLQTQIRWLTAEDEKVCPICNPADHKLREQEINTPKGGWNGQTWGNRFGRPPAHPNCRCQTVVELPTRKPRNG